MENLSLDVHCQQNITYFKTSFRQSQRVALSGLMEMATNLPHWTTSASMGRERQSFARTIKESIFKRGHNPTLKRIMGNITFHT